MYETKHDTNVQLGLVLASSRLPAKNASVACALTCLACFGIWLPPRCVKGKHKQDHRNAPSVRGQNSVAQMRKKQYRQYPVHRKHDRRVRADGDYSRPSWCHVYVCVQTIKHRQHQPYQILTSRIRLNACMLILAENVEAKRSTKTNATDKRRLKANRERKACVLPITIRNLNPSLRIAIEVQ